MSFLDIPQVLKMEFNPKHSIRAVKGFALKNFKSSMGADVNPKSLSVHFLGKPMKDAVKLAHLECGNSALVVQYEKQQQQQKQP